VTVFRAAKSTRKRDTLLEGMEKLAPGRVCVRHVAGNHMAIILDPTHVQLFARELQSCLEQASAGESATVKKMEVGSRDVLIATSAPL